MLTQSVSGVLLKPGDRVFCYHGAMRRMKRYEGVFVEYTKKTLRVEFTTVLGDRYIKSFKPENVELRP